MVQESMGDSATPNSDPAVAAAGTVGVACALASQGVQIVRVHDVAAVRAALLLYEAATGA